MTMWLQSKEFLEIMQLLEKVNKEVEQLKDESKEQAKQIKEQTKQTTTHTVLLAQILTRQPEKP